jgi:transcription elongation factor Elf1
MDQQPANPISVTVTCVADGCENSSIPLTVTTYSHANVICGPCGATLIDDVPET